MKDLDNRLTIAISSRALFDLEKSNKIFETEGKEAYERYQLSHEDEPLAPGVAFQLTNKLLKLNEHGAMVEVVLLSRNSANTGLRVFNSIQHYKMDITRAVFTNGENPYGYAGAFKADLFLSANPLDVEAALAAGFAAAHLYTDKVKDKETYDEQIRIAFDGDAVLFSDESEKIYQEKGFEAFLENEQKEAKQPLPAGPFLNFLLALQNLQAKFQTNACPIRTALVTARSAPAHERVIRTLRSWDIRIDEALFLGGLEKRDFLKAFKADIFFDDQIIHCESTNGHVATGHVPNGVKNARNFPVES